MPEELTILLTIVGGLAFAGLLCRGLIYALDRHHAVEVPGSIPASEIIRRENFCHPAPWLPYSVAEAHMVMQALIDCDADSCADKNAAYRVLINAGRIQPTAQSDRATR